MWHFIDGRGGWLSLAILKPPLNLSKRAPKIILPEKFMPNSKQKGFTKMNEFEETFFMIFDRLILKFSRAWFSQIWRLLGRGIHCIQQWCNMFRIFWIINFYISDIKRGTKVKKTTKLFHSDSHQPRILFLGGCEEDHDLLDSFEVWISAGRPVAPQDTKSHVLVLFTRACNGFTTWVSLIGPQPHL